MPAPIYPPFLTHSSNGEKKGLKITQQTTVCNFKRYLDEVTCSTVALMSRVSVVVIVCRAIGCSLPTGTLPIWTQEITSISRQPTIRTSSSAIGRIPSKGRYRCCNSGILVCCKHIYFASPRYCKRWQILLLCNEKNYNQKEKQTCDSVLCPSKAYKWDRISLPKWRSVAIVVAYHNCPGRSSFGLIHTFAISGGK